MAKQRQPKSEQLSDRRLLHIRGSGEGQAMCGRDVDDFIDAHLTSEDVVCGMCVLTSIREHNRTVDALNRASVRLNLIGRAADPRVENDELLAFAEGEFGE